MKDDIIDEEPEAVQKALARLTDKEMFDRNFRIRRAVQLNMLHEVLPKELQTTKEQDVRYLWPHILDVCREEEEKLKYEKRSE